LKTFAGLPAVAVQWLRAPEWLFGKVTSVQSFSRVSIAGPQISGSTRLQFHNEGLLRSKRAEFER
jgi:hypothetical protein